MNHSIFQLIHYDAWVGTDGRARDEDKYNEFDEKLQSIIKTVDETLNPKSVERIFNEKDPRFAKYYDKKGFPRTIPQAEALKKMLSERGHQIAAMIELYVPEDELMKRLLLRGQLSGRSDDNEETIKKRLDVYHHQTQPLIKWYDGEGIHYHVEGLGTVDEIFSRICEVIDRI